ncbi:MAG: GHKL domain-containing protein [Alphaproteobacteria bacterium]|nr:GHKL domain-containing protein [Alphaproteobacteria bacterium]
MRKNKTLNVVARLSKITARVLVLNIPAVIILLVLLLTHRLSWMSAGISLLAFWSISTIIVFYVFKDLDNFMVYLKKLAQGFEPELPKFHWGIFSSTRLTKTFLSVKNLWSNQFLSDSAILQNLPNPMLMIRPDQKVVFANASAQQFFTKRVMDNKLSKLFKDDAFMGVVLAVLDGDIPSKTLPEWETTDAKGQFAAFQVKVDKLPAETKDGAVVAISFFDITPFKLFKIQQADFFANASHELKTPLAIISGCVETLQGEAKDDPVATNKFLSMIADQNTRMTDLVQKMLKLSRLQMDVPLSANQSFSLNDLIQKVVSDLNVRCQTLNKKIVFNKGRNLPLLKGNRDELYHVFQNLTDNALKYSDDHSTIRITTHFATPKKSIVISVHNFGKPIPKENLNRIFDKFFRVDRDKNHAVEGSGLGLGIVQQIVQKHNGHIEVQSTEKDGTTFFVYFPVEE